MKRSFVFTLVTALALCATEVYSAEPNKNTKEANRLAREGAEAAKGEDWDKAVESLRKATDTPPRRTSSFRRPSRTLPKRSKSSRTTRAFTSNAQQRR